jgi:hypothetical protein
MLEKELPNHEESIFLLTSSMKDARYDAYLICKEKVLSPAGFLIW